MAARAQWQLLRGLFRELQLQCRVSMPRIEERTPHVATDRGRMQCGVDFPHRWREL